MNLDCKIDDCHRPAHARGWCKPHYEKARIHGDPLRGRVNSNVCRPQTLMGRFWGKVRCDHDTGCWNWTGAAHRLGYGTLNVAGRYVRAYRFAYEQLVGPIPEGLELDHLCRNPRCVNPEHLEPVTHAENTRRMREANYSGPLCKRGHDKAVWMRSRPSGSDYCIACAYELRHAS